MRSRPEAGSTDQDWGEKRAQNTVTSAQGSAPRTAYGPRAEGWPSLTNSVLKVSKRRAKIVSMLLSTPSHAMNGQGPICQGSNLSQLFSTAFQPFHCNLILSDH